MSAPRKEGKIELLDKMLKALKENEAPEASSRIKHENLLRIKVQLMQYNAGLPAEEQIAFKCLVLLPNPDKDSAHKYVNADTIFTAMKDATIMANASILIKSMQEQKFMETLESIKAKLTVQPASLNSSKSIPVGGKHPRSESPTSSPSSSPPKKKPLPVLPDSPKGSIASGGMFARPQDRNVPHEENRRSSMRPGKK